MAQEKQAQVAEAGALSGLDEFSDILRQTIKPRTDVAAKEVDNAVVALVREALDDQTLIAEDVIDTIDAMLSKLDQKLTEQLNEIIHHEEFQKLESSWRGLAYTINNSETDASLRVKVMNVSKKELQQMMRRYPGAKWDKSPLNKIVYEAEFGTLGGKPFGALVGDYYFDHSTADVALLRDIGKIAAAAHAPFISSAAPELLGLDSWNELSVPPDLSEIFDTPDYAAWNGLRDSENSRYVALTLPRVLSREPYGQGSNSVVEEFNFEEETDGHDGTKYGWMNAAHAMAVNINRAHKEHGWTVQIRGVQSGGEVLNLPTHNFDTGDGSKDLKCPTEVSITDRREAELSKAGLIGLIHRKHTDKAAFIGAQTLYRPKKYVDEQATASDNMSARLPYIFAVSRFSHYLKCMVRDKIGQSPDRLQLQTQLQTWVNKYVSGNPESASEREKAKKPLAGAKVEVVEDEENPGYYMGKFYLKPHFQLEGMDVGMSLVSKLPKGK
ncbi:type VI secretion system contractile sheath large subunit [Paracoccus siganidrum]|uniref:Type VI secretion system contractile sheath large subunit n=1 Tax=Paracoccus siganidrum TaxID=1276757 RepID=A0A419AC82_9RHOB|nr:type VI secretion system contractile sheath large subunit [Paracoccus siganidrum]RJL21818.1 type VI secretion system contractile sheath large subunit [Paracoccus siganidrum]RMC38171.1 type VI secretion system contractile sheath large subunit [Paracoccus siganidrum]